MDVNETENVFAVRILTISPIGQHSQCFFCDSHFFP